MTPLLKKSLLPLALAALAGVTIPIRSHALAQPLERHAFVEMQAQDSIRGIEPYSGLENPASIVAGLGSWQLVSRTGPSPRYLQAMAYDQLRGRMVLFGGYDANGWNNETWTWGQKQWRRENPTNIPQARWGAAMVYDVARGVCVLFGGVYHGLYLNDTWEWDGKDWTQRASISATPGGRYLHAMAYDRTRRVVVMFGGTNGPGAMGNLGDTWEWNGLEWILRSPASPLSARFGHSMAYDTARGVTLLFGGEDALGRSNETWQWNGNEWTPMIWIASPTARCFQAMAYDEGRGDMVMFGGCNATIIFNDTCIWNGTDWSTRALRGPAARNHHSMAYDSREQTVLLFGGAMAFDPLSFNGETWVWRAK